MNKAPQDPENSITFAIEGDVVLAIDKTGFTYQGEHIEDAGQAHKAWMEAMGMVAARRHDQGVDNFIEKYDVAEEEAMDLDPAFLLECITYGMVEGGYMPTPSAENVGAAIVGTVQCLDAMLEDTESPKWRRDAIQAMRADLRLIKTFIHSVFLHGWSQGGSWVPGVDLEELRDLIPQSAEDRIRMYFCRFNDKMRCVDYHPVIYRGDLDVIPCALNPEGMPIWEVYHVPSGFTIEEGFSDVTQAWVKVHEFQEEAKEV